MKQRAVWMVLCAVGIAGILSCVNNPPNTNLVGGSETESYTGMAKLPDGKPAQGAIVYVIKKGINDTSSLIVVDTTDSSGQYFFTDTSLKTTGGLIKIVSNSLSTIRFSGVFTPNFDQPHDTINFGTCKLQPAGSIKGSILEYVEVGSPNVTIILRFYGFPLADVKADSTGAYLFTDLASGNYELDLIPSDSRFVELTRSNVAVFPDSVTTVTISSLIDIEKAKASSQFQADSLIVRHILDTNHISLSVMGLVKISEDFRISELALSNKNLKIIPREIGSLAGIRSLDLSINVIDSLPSTLFDLPLLTSLDISDNRIAVLSHSIVKCTTLVSLRCANNFLDSLPQEIGKLVNLNELELANNNLTKIPASLGKCKKLTYLGVNNNRLLELPGSLGLCPNLEKLFCDGNNIVALPDSLTLCTKLQYLSIAHNLSVITLPATLGNLAELKYLIATGCKLASLPASIGKITGLIDLSVNSNLLTALPPEIVNLRNLYMLKLQANKLCTLETVMSIWALGVQPRSLDSQVCDTTSYKPIVIESPLNGAVYTPGMSIPILWHTNLVGKRESGNIGISISVNGGQTYSDIIGNVSRGYPTWGNYRYYIPTTIAGNSTISSQCQIKLVDYVQKSIFEISPPFAIVSQDSLKPLALVSPRPAQIYTIGDTLNVTWKVKALATFDVQAVACSVSVDSGSNYFPLTPISFVYNQSIVDSDWVSGITYVIPDTLKSATTVVSTHSSKCLIKAADFFWSSKGGECIQDIMNGCFTIQ